MQPLVNAYWTGKSGGTPDEYEDAFAFSQNGRHFAIADGATESSFADRWAKSLVQRYLKEPPTPAGRLPLWEWVRPLQEEWYAGINWDTLPWFAEEKARMGAFATILGVSFISPGTRKAPSIYASRLHKRAPDKLVWRALAVGDSCLFQVRNDLLIKSFPLTKSDEFDSRPLLLSSNPENNDPVWKAIATDEGEVRPGDIFLALTDALAKWFFLEVESGNQPWNTLLSIQSPEEFEKFVQQLRANKMIRNDDTTMVCSVWGKEPTSSRTTISKRGEL